MKRDYEYVEPVIGHTLYGSLQKYATYGIGIISSS